VRVGPRPWRLLVTVGALLLSPWISAESLEQAWQLAIEHDPVLAAAGADLEEAQASERAARAARWPSLTANAAYTRFSTAPQFDFSAGGFALQHPIFSGDDSASGAVRAKLPLYTGGRTSAGIDAAHQATAGASELQRDARSSLRLDVAQSYVDVLRARRALRTAESSVASLRPHVSDVERMVERELVARSDLLAARVALANAEQQRVRAENGIALAYAAYNRRLGQSLARIPDLDETITVDPTFAAEPLETLIARALDARAEIAVLSAHADGLALQSKAERAELLPQLALSGGYTYFENEILDRKDFASVGIDINWNLFDGGAARNRSAALRHASRAARHRLDDLRTLIELEVREAWHDLQGARARIAAAREAVAESDENLRITRELYGTGLGTNTQVLDAVALQVAATGNRDNAALDESMALLRLTRAVGAL
jgi:outer membrane protein TolC